MLVREDGGRHEYRNLLAAHDSLERSSERNLGLTVSYVAAEQSVHGVRLFHVLSDVVYRGKLSVRLLVFKRIGKFPAHIVVGVKGNTLRSLSSGVKLNKLLCHLSCCGFGFALCAHPVRSAHLRQLYHACVRACSDVFRYVVELIYRQKQLVASGVFYVNIVPRSSVDRQRLKSHVLTDTVGFMHDDISDFEVRV